MKNTNTYFYIYIQLDYIWEGLRKKYDEVLISIKVTLKLYPNKK